MQRNTIVVFQKSNQSMVKIGIMGTQYVRMRLNAGIVGLPNAGKSTLFNVLVSK